MGVVKREGKKERWFVFSLSLVERLLQHLDPFSDLYRQR